MTTTAHEDQFTDAPEPVRQTYSTADILRRNVADLEIALKQQTERAEKAESELTKLREQEPVAYVKYKATGGNVGLSWFAIPTQVYYPREGEPLYVNPIPVPAPAVPEEWRNIVTKMLGWWDAPVMTMSQGKFIAEKARALLQSAGGDK